MEKKITDILRAFQTYNKIHDFTIRSLVRFLWTKNFIILTNPKKKSGPYILFLEFSSFFSENLKTKKNVLLKDLRTLKNIHN